MIQGYKELERLVNERLVTVQKHPIADLFIYNYVPAVQYGKLWTPLLKQCRGLILDGNYNIISRPFGKFFNASEHTTSEIPNEPFEVYSKEDGSLGISYYDGNKIAIATRGSFSSDQALKATEMLYKQYPSAVEIITKNSNRTYLFEIIYPENRIVVDYGKSEKLILLAVIDNYTGNDLSLEDIGIPVVEKLDGINDFSKLKDLAGDNKEGFVVKFKNSFRIKIKFDEYVRLHRIITGVSNVAIWEYLSENKPFDELLEKVPDEFYNYVKKTQKELQDKYTEILNESKAVFKELSTRKETALYFQKQKYPSILFSMLDGKTPDKIIWKMIRPKFCKPFKTDES